MKKPFYITTTLPYVNAVPHVGFAMEIIRVDVMARWKRLQGFDVFFNTGTDEHGLKIYRKAAELGKDTQEYVDENAAQYLKLKEVLNLSFDNFIRTTDKDHVEAAREFWRVCDKNGYIYKKKYQIKYCVGCELEKTESELAGGKCPIHPNLELELIAEENYFFKFSAFQKPLLDFYGTHPDFVVPDSRYKEIKSFVGRGLQDFSISRLKSKMPWGIQVPGDPEQVAYVWFDALVNYISAIGWPRDMEKFEKWQIESGGMVQYCGKDNLRQQSAMWQAMLMASGLPNSKQIVIDGFVTGDGGVKMSKSLGNTVDPVEIVNEYGTDALRYFVLRELHPFEDTPFTLEKFKEAHNANLANGLGNLVSRVMKMAEMSEIRYQISDVGFWMSDFRDDDQYRNLLKKYEESLERYDIKAACDLILDQIQKTDRKIQETQPFKLVKTDSEAGGKIIVELLSRVEFIAELLRPVLPFTSEKIFTTLKEGKSLATPLFPRKE